MPRSQQNRSFKTTTPSTIVKSQPLTPYIPVQPSAPGFGQLIKEGIGFGAGQAIAHRAVNAVLGSSAAVSQPISQTKLCNSEREAFESCLKTQTGDSLCNNELTAYKQCIEFK
jgi:hypothetical protein